MSSAFVHVAVGVLVALAVRIDWRFVAAAAVLAEVPDVDHLWGSGMRSALHTWWFLVLLPSAVAAAALATRRIPDRWRRFAAAAPALLLSHMLLDLFPQPSEHSSRFIPLFEPFDKGLWQVAPLLGEAARPTALSSLGIVTFLLALAATMGYLAPQLTFWLESRQRKAWWVGLAYGMWWPMLLWTLVVVRVIRPA